MQRAGLRTFTSRLISDYIRAVRLSPGEDGPRIRIEDEPDDEKMHARTVADLIASMTEDQAYTLYAHVTGATHGDNLRASWF